MDKQKQKRLEKKGWVLGSTKDFLGLSKEEEAMIELRLTLSQAVKAFRKEKSWTQEELASAIGSSQSRIAKIENGDTSVSIDLMMRSLLHLGVSLQVLAQFETKERKQA